MKTPSNPRPATNSVSDAEGWSGLTTTTTSSRLSLSLNSFAIAGLSGEAEGEDVAYSPRQRRVGPGDAAVHRREDAAVLRRAMHMAGRAWIGRDREDRAFQRPRQLGRAPGLAVVAADEEGAPITVEIVSGAQVDGSRVLRGVGDRPAV